MPSRAAMFVVAAALSCGVASRASIESIDFELYRGHLIVIRAEAGHLDDLRFLVDTGTNRTVIDDELAASLGLEGRGSSVQTFGRTMSGADVVFPDLRLGSVRTEGLRVVAADLSATGESLGLDRLDGIIGMDVLGRTSFTIDYGLRRLTLGATTRGRFRVPLAPDPVFPVVRVDIAGVPADLVVDTGASHVVLFLSAGDRIFQQGGAVAASILGGTVPLRGLFLPELRLGSWRLRDLPAVVAEAPVGRRPVKGLLAPTVLGSSLLRFDLRRRELSWGP